MRAGTISDGVLGAVGDTPLVRLRRLVPQAGFDVCAKLEYLNPGGSLKDRPALAIINDAMASGQINSSTVVIESSSGNLAIGLAQVCLYLGLRIICVVDPRTTQQNLAILNAYGAELDVVREPDPATGEYLPARIRRVRSLLNEHPDGFWPNQYANLQNPGAHQRTMGEIAEALDGRVDYLFCATSTCGTLRGCAEYVREHGLATQIVAVDAAGSVIFGSSAGDRLLPGYGAGVRPSLWQPGLADRLVRVTDRQAVMACREMLQREAIFAGASSGAVVAGLRQLSTQIRPGSRCVLVLADRGERYLDTVYSSEWVREHLGRGHGSAIPVNETVNSTA